MICGNCALSARRAPRDAPPASRRGVSELGASIPLTRLASCMRSHLLLERSCSRALVLSPAAHGDRLAELARHVRRPVEHLFSRAWLALVERANRPLLGL